MEVSAEHISWKRESRIDVECYWEMTGQEGKAQTRGHLTDPEIDTQRLCPSKAAHLLTSPKKTDVRNQSIPSVATLESPGKL